MTIELAEEILKYSLLPLEFDSSVNNYTMPSRTIPSSKLKEWHSISCNKGEFVPLETFRCDVDLLLKQTVSPNYLRIEEQYGFPINLLVVGEVFDIRSLKNNRSLSLMVYNSNSFLVLNSRDSSYSRNTILQIDDETQMMQSCFANLWNTLSSAISITFILPGIFHRAVDRVFFPELPHKKIGTSIAPLYEFLLKAIREESVHNCFDSICKTAQNLGLSSFVVRQLINTLVNLQY